MIIFNQQLIEPKLKLYRYITIILRMDKRATIIFSTLLYLTFLNGWYTSSFGPLIPFLSLESGLDETQFSYIFFVRFLGCVTGGFLIKVLIVKFTTQFLSIFMNIIIFAFLNVATISLSKYWLIFVIFIASIAYVCLSVIIYGVVFKLISQQVGSKIQIVAFMFGVGAMIGPLLVIILEMTTFTYLGIAHLIAIISFLKYPLPDLDKNSNELQVNNKNKISRKSQGFICLIMLIFASAQLGYGSWIPTYSIKANISDPEQSGIYSMIFWSANCMFRLIWLYVPGSITKKLQYSLLGLLITSALLLFMQYLQLYYGICTFGSFMVGIFTSSIYSFCIALPADNGFQSSTSNTSNFILSNSFGEGFLITPIGYGMSYFGYKSLILITFILALASNWSLREAINGMRKDALAIQHGQNKIKLIQRNQIGNQQQQ